MRKAPEAQHDEIVALVERCGLGGCGIGRVDAHPLASAKLAGTRLCTVDGRPVWAARALDLLAPF